MRPVQALGLASGWEVWRHACFSASHRLYNRRMQRGCWHSWIGIEQKVRIFSFQWPYYLLSLYLSLSSQWLGFPVSLPKISLPQSNPHPTFLFLWDSCENQKKKKKLRCFVKIHENQDMFLKVCISCSSKLGGQFPVSRKLVLIYLYQCLQGMEITGQITAQEGHF